MQRLLSLLKATRELIQRAERMTTPPFSSHLSLRKRSGKLEVYTVYLRFIYWVPEVSLI